MIANHALDRLTMQEEPSVESTNTPKLLVVHATALWTIPKDVGFRWMHRVIHEEPVIIESPTHRKAVFNLVYTNVVNQCLATVLDRFPLCPVADILKVQSVFPSNQTFFLFKDVAYAIELAIELREISP